MPYSLSPRDLKESYICLSVDVFFAMFRHRQTILLLEKLQNLWDFQTLPYHDWSTAKVGAKGFQRPHLFLQGCISSSSGQAWNCLRMTQRNTDIYKMKVKFCKSIFHVIQPFEEIVDPGETAASWN